MLRLIIYLQVLLSEQQATDRKSGTEDKAFFLSRKKLGGFVTQSAANNGCKIFMSEVPDQIHDEFEKVLSELFEEGILDLRGGFVRVGDEKKFNKAITTHPFANFIVGIAGHLFPKKSEIKS